MVSTLERLRTTYGANGEKPKTPTPVQVKRQIDQQAFLIELSEKTGITDHDFFLAIFFSKAGKFIPDKFQRFLISFKEMIDKYGDNICNCIDDKCVKPTGEIQEARLRRNRRKK